MGSQLSWGWAAPANDSKVGCREDMFSISVVVDDVLFDYDSYLTWLWKEFKVDYKDIYNPDRKEENEGKDSLCTFHNKLEK